MLTSFSGNFKDPMITGMPYWPQYHIKEFASFGGHTFYYNLTFNNFKSTTTWCGDTQVIFDVNPFATDYTPPIEIYDTTFNVSISTSFIICKIERRQ